MDTAVAGSPTDVATRLAAVQAQIAGAAQRAGRDPAAVTLVAVSKTFPPERIQEAVVAGARDFGENRVQEAEAKVPLLPAGVSWHLVGHLQRNKVNKALDLFALIHSVDSLELAHAIGARANGMGKQGHVLLQVNVSGKVTQSGFAPEGVTEAAVALAETPGLALAGLMCIAPEVDDPEETRPAFRRLAALFGDVEQKLRHTRHSWRHLSMGMSNDFGVAIEEGATLVRIGRAVFGERAPAPAVQA